MTGTRPDAFRISMKTDVVFVFKLDEVWQSKYVKIVSVMSVLSFPSSATAS